MDETIESLYEELNKKADGVQDCTDLIQKIFNHQAHLPPGTYKITAPIQFEGRH